MKIINPYMKIGIGQQSFIYEHLHTHALHTHTPPPTSSPPPTPSPHTHIEAQIHFLHPFEETN